MSDTLTAIEAFTGYTCMETLAASILGAEVALLTFTPAKDVREHSSVQAFYTSHLIAGYAVGIACQTFV